MPQITTSTYRPPPGFNSGHLQTIYPVLCRRVTGIAYTRERIETPDSDFLDLDWLMNGRNRLAILSHGLEGNTRRSYILGMARALERRGWDVLAWNCRGCSGEPNRRLRSYHSGATEDLDTVVQHAAQQNRYKAMALVGFSLGGNMTLKYAGEQGADLHPLIKAAVGISVPCDLASSSRKMASHANRIYMWRFLRCLRQKVRAKQILFPGQINDTGYHRLRTFADFDNRYTAPLHGFRDAEDYWARASAKPFLDRIRIPALLLNARDDPFLAPECFPEPAARQNPNFHMETPGAGGHVGFVNFNVPREYWSESRVGLFLEETTETSGTSRS